MKPRLRAIRPTDDLAQEVFRRLLRDGDEVAASDPLGYLVRTATTIENEWVGRARQTKPLDEPDSANESMPPLDSIQAALNTLSPCQREVLLLHVHEGLTCLQIAQRRGSTYEAVLHELARAYSQLTLELGSRSSAEIEEQEERQEEQ